MSEWCDFAIRLDGPESKTGYNGANKTHNKVGVVLHTMEYESGPAWDDATTLHNALFSGREASWTFSVCKFMNGAILFQHYPLAAVCWAQGYQGNLWLIGIETEGIAPGKFTEPQYELLVKLLKWIKEAQVWLDEWEIGDRRIVFGLGVGSLDAGWLFEHNAVPGAPATNCAVFTHGQVDAARLLADLKEEPMTLSQADHNQITADAKKLIEDMVRNDWHMRRWSSGLLRKAAGFLETAAGLCDIAWSDAEYAELAEMVQRAKVNIDAACSVLAHEGLGPETGNKKIEGLG